MEKLESLKRVFTLVALWVLSFVVTFSSGNVEKEYDERGIEVTATIMQVIKGPRRHTNYICTYYNEQGENVEARLTLNQFGGEVGQVVVGKYLPETPEHVYCKASNTLKYGVSVFAYIITILYTIAFFIGGSEKNDEEDTLEIISTKGMYDEVGTDNVSPAAESTTSSKLKEEECWNSMPAPGANVESKTSLKLKIPDEE